MNAEILDLTELRLLEYLVMRDGWWISYEDAADYCGVSVARCREAMNELESTGYAKHSPRTDEDGRPNGSGWFVVPGKVKELARPKPGKPA